MPGPAHVMRRTPFLTCCCRCCCCFCCCCGFVFLLSLPDLGPFRMPPDAVFNGILILFAYWPSCWRATSRNTFSRFHFARSSQSQESEPHLQLQSQLRLQLQLQLLQFLRLLSMFRSQPETKSKSAAPPFDDSCRVKTHLENKTR